MSGNYTRLSSRGIVIRPSPSNLDWSRTSSECCRVPRPPSRRRLSGFWTTRTRRLERAIRAKRKVIALLNEQKQAIIHRAVTRGLDPSVPLKPSGIPWLGDIPQHWEVTALRRRLSARVRCSVRSHGSRDGICWRRSHDHRRHSRVRVNENRTMFNWSAIVSTASQSSVRPGDFVVTAT